MVKKHQGFTLIELLVVVAIIGILVAIAIPKLMRAITRAYEAKTYSNLNAYRKCLEMYYIDYHQYPAMLNNITDVNLMQTSLTTLWEKVGDGPLPGCWVCDWTEAEWEAAGWIQSADAQGGWNYCRYKGIVWIDEDDISLMNGLPYNEW